MEDIQQHVEQPAVEAMPVVDAPVPLSFPAVLRNPGMGDRFAHLRTPYAEKSPSVPAAKRVRKRHENEGKRWVRRYDNARFVGNPHIVPATKYDLQVPPPTAKRTFPEPLPAYLPRSVKVPGAALPEHNAASANAGRFSRSMKGMRKDLRKAGYKAEFLVREIESEILDWIHNVRPRVTMLDAEGLGRDEERERERQLVGETSTVWEVERTPLQLVWAIPDDVFARFVVHSCARYHEIVSFSKDIGGERLTILLRPNATRPGAQARGAMDTPPVTDLDNSSHYDSASDFPSSDQEAMSAIDESDAQSIVDINPPRFAVPPPIREGSVLSDQDDSWSVIGGTDIDADSEGDMMSDMAASVGSLSLDADTTLTEATAPPVMLFTRESRRQQLVRSSSSPSRSPSRRPGRRMRTRPQLKHVPAQTSTLFEYVYC